MSVSIATLLAHACAAKDDAKGATQHPIYLASTFLRRRDGSFIDNRIYSRDDSPMLEPAEAALAAAEGGASAMLFSSGLGACAAIFATQDPGTRIITPETLYYGVESWLSQWAARADLDVVSVDYEDLDRVRAAIDCGRPSLLWIETPGNPFLNITDLEAVCDLARAYGSCVVVDSSVATPVLTQPLTHGAHLVVHSATKYLGGHSDLLGGAVVTRDCDARWDRITAYRYDHGCQLGNFEAWLLARSLETLPVRVRQASANAIAVAQWLSRHPAVEKVHYPGLPDDPGHGVARRQMQGGFSGLLSFIVRSGEAEAVRICSEVRLVKRATSFGGVQSSIEHHASVREAYEGSAVPRGLLRLSVGIEDLDDILADLGQAFAAAATLSAAADHPDQRSI